MSATTTRTKSSWFPAAAWLRQYNKKLFRGDCVAAITLAAYLLPAALGDASLANLPPETGLYACLFGGLVFWVFCSSRYTIITVTSAISLLIGASVSEIAKGDTARFGALAADLLALQFIEYLTEERLAESSSSSMRWKRHRVRYPLWYEVRPALNALAGRRAPSRFDVWETIVP